MQSFLSEEKIIRAKGLKNSTLSRLCQPDSVQWSCLSGISKWIPKSVDGQMNGVCVSACACVYTTYIHMVGNCKNWKDGAD